MGRDRWATRGEQDQEKWLMVVMGEPESVPRLVESLVGENSSPSGVDPVGGSAMEGIGMSLCRGRWSALSAKHEAIALKLWI